MSDLISRQAAIDAVRHAWAKGLEPSQYIEDLPPAQPEERTDKRTETHACDCISRLGAIDDLHGKDPSQILDTADVEVWINALPSVQPEIVRCCKCSFWDRDTLNHQFNDFRDWNEVECKILAERDPYCEINRYTEADDFCSYAERRTDGTD